MPEIPFQHHILTKPPDFDMLHGDTIGHLFRSRPAANRNPVIPSQKFGRIKQEDFICNSGRKRRSHHPAAAFYQETCDLHGSEALHQSG